MAWYLMYLYDSEMPDKRPRRYLFSRLENIPQECSREAEARAKVFAEHIWRGLLSEVYNKSTITDPEVVWRVELEMPTDGSGKLDADLVDVLKMADEMELTAGGEVSVGVHEPDPTAEA
ncbi:MAG: hypothetical protein AAB501_03290 [Patescibacteria group bacterium]